MMALLGASGLAQTAGRTQLEYRDVPDTEHPLIAGTRLIAGNYGGVPSDAKGPEGLSAGAKWHAVTLSGLRLLIITEPRSDRIYVDTNLDRNLADEAAITGTRYTSPALTPNALVHFGPVEIQWPGEGGGVRIRIITRGQDLVMVMQAGFVTAKVPLPDGARSVAVIDANYDGRYDGVMGTGATADGFAIDANDDGTIETAPEAGEMFALPWMFKSGETWLAMKVEPNGSALTLEEATPVLGSVRVQSTDAYALAWSQYGMQRIGGTTEPVKVPIGKYQTAAVLVSVKDSKGIVWKANSSSLPRELASFEVEEGRTTELAFGAPLTLTVDASENDAKQRSFGMSIVGVAGEKYSPSVTFNGNATPAPGIRILGEDGKVLAAGAFSYG